MPGLDQLPNKDWGKAASSVIKPLLLSRGTLETIDLARTRLLCEEVLHGGKDRHCRFVRELGDAVEVVATFKGKPGFSVVRLAR